jgi:hypothetical protein
MSGVDESKTILTSNGSPIYWLPKDPQNHLDKTTLIFGGSGSGKTTIIDELLYQLKDYIPNFLVIAPRTSDTTYRKKLPSRCIKEDLTKRKLQQIWDRQYNITQLYNTANDIAVLESLFKKRPDRETYVMLSAIKKRASEVINDIENKKELDFAQKKSQKIAIEELLNKRIKTLYKTFITKYKNTLENMDLSPHERIAVEYAELNPRFCLIIDDCSEKFQSWMKYFKKGEVNPFESIFYKGRWNYLTLIFAAHDDKLVNPELRKNARVTIYTNSQALVASINKTGNGFTTKDKKEAMAYANRIFNEEKTGVKTHQKLCYVREDIHPFRYTIANLYPDFILGCYSLRDLVSKLPKKDDNLKSNPFVKELFKKDKFD